MPKEGPRGPVTSSPRFKARVRLVAKNIQLVRGGAAAGAQCSVQAISG